MADSAYGAGMGDSLRVAWFAAKPIYESGEPERAGTQHRFGRPARLERLAPTVLACVAGPAVEWLTA